MSRGLTCCQYCAENLEFWIAVDKFKDFCVSCDLTNNPEQIRKCGEAAVTVWRDFICQNSNREVSLPCGDRRETIMRLTKIEQYRERVFDIALQDPIQTLHKDIRHRFLMSSHFAEFCTRERQCEFEKLPSVKAPKQTVLDFDFPDNRTESDFTLTEMTCDKYLYRALRKYLEARTYGHGMKQRTVYM